MNAEEILSRCRGLSALVIGDICLDRWCEYDPDLSEASAETGIPRIAVVSYRSTAGAGGTVARNLAALGLRRVDVLGIAGEDAHGYELLQALRTSGVAADLMRRSSDVSTFTYTKLINRKTGVEDQPRVDFVNASDPPPRLDKEIAGLTAQYAGQFDVVLVSDQAETESGGVVSAAVRRALSGVARRYPEKVIWVDSRRRLEKFSGVTLKANESEARAACARLASADGFASLQAETAAPNLFVTLGAEGVLIGGREDGRVPARYVESPVDICGAGDSFSAAAAVTLALTGDARQAAEFGNLVAAITIQQKGTGTASPELVRAALR